MEQKEKDKMERVEKHLYKLQHRTKGGEWSRRFYGIFVDWQKIPRRIPLGDDLKIARDRLGEVHNLNGRSFNFDSERLPWLRLTRKQRQEETKRREQEENAGMTFREWGELYFKDKALGLGKRPGAIDRERHTFKKLLAHFGDTPLCQINRTAITTYLARRSQDTVVRDGKDVKISFVTANRELAFVRYLLNWAYDDGLIENAPRIKLQSEKGRQRTRTITEREYSAILDNMKRPQQRYIIALYETGMRLNEPRKLTWDKIDLRKGLIRLAAEDVKENWPRRTPITWGLREVFEALKAEQRKIPNVGNLVFTRQNAQPIRSVRTAFQMALEKADIEDRNIVPHDFRRTAISRWTAIGIPRDVVMVASGHKPSGVHDKYINFTDEQLVAAFARVGLMLPPSERKAASQVAAAL